MKLLLFTIYHQLLSRYTPIIIQVVNLQYQIYFCYAYQETEKSSAGEQLSWDINRAARMLIENFYQINSLKLNALLILLFFEIVDYQF